MNWKDIAGKVTDFAPAIGSALGGPAGGAAGTVLASVFGTEDSPDAVSKAIQQDPEAAAKLKQAELDHAAEMRRMVIEAETNRLTQVNRTIRSEAAADDAYVRRWRPTFGYLAAVTWALQSGGLVYAIIAEPSAAPKIIEAVGSLSMMWSVALGVLGVSVHQRSKDKQVKAGQQPKGMIQGAIEALRK